MVTQFGLLCLITLVYFSLKKEHIRYGIIFMILGMTFLRVLQWIMDWSVLSKCWFNILMICMFVPVFFLNKGRKRITWNKLDICMLLFLIHGLVVTALTYGKRDLMVCMNGFRTYFFGGIIYFTIRKYITDKAEVKTIFRWLIIACILIGFEAIFEFLLFNLLGVDWRILPWFSEEVTGVLIDSPDRVKIGHLFRPLGLLAYVHYTTYVIGIGVLLLFPFLAYPVQGDKMKKINNSLFVVLYAAMIATTTRSINIIVPLIIIMAFYFFDIAKTKLYLVLFMLVVGLFVAIKLSISDFFSLAFTSQDVFYESFNPEFLLQSEEFPLLDLIFGRGFYIGAAAKTMAADRIDLWEPGFHFNQLNEQFHFLLYMDRIGLIGGILFIMQSVFAFRIAKDAWLSENDRYLKNVLMGLSLCPLLLLLSSVHILHTDVVMQFFTYITMGIIGSTADLKSAKR